LNTIRAAFAVAHYLRASESPTLSDAKPEAETRAEWAENLCQKISTAKYSLEPVQKFDPSLNSVVEKLKHDYNISEADSRGALDILTQTEWKIPITEASKADDVD